MASRGAEGVVRWLTDLWTVAFFLLLVVTGIALVGLPIAKVANDGAGWTIGVQIEAPASPGMRLATRWPGTTLEVDYVRGRVPLPIGRLSWSAFAKLWLFLAAAMVVGLLFLHHLRRLFQRVRDGAPFDPGNAGRLRWMAGLAMGYAVLGAAGRIAAAQAVAGEGMAFGLMIEMPRDGSVVVLGLVLLALAEVFRRGAEMEAEQALVI